MKYMVQSNCAVAYAATRIIASTEIKQVLKKEASSMVFVMPL